MRLLQTSLLGCLSLVPWKFVEGATWRRDIGRSAANDVARRAQGTSTSNITVDFEVDKPVTIPTKGVCATQTLMVYDFGNSYGQPYVGSYTPPDCDFNSVVITFTSNSSGRQYDRLGMMYLGSTEIWRTSTSEPTPAGIRWEYVKDMSQYLALWKEPQTVIFDLDNVVTDVYTGFFNTTLTATFFTVQNAPVKADAILPISTLQGPEGGASVFNIPSQVATVAYTIPDNVTHATVSISANGQINEEFWYQNVFTSQAETFEDTAGTLLAGGPFREIQLLIDGHLAGVVWPFPVIFTGGVAPGFWRPISGIQSYDLHESEIDISPFLPYLADGKPHNFTISIFQITDQGGTGAATLTEVESYWLATGKIFLFYGKGPKHSAAVPKVVGANPIIEISSKISKSADGSNATLWYLTTASRELTISSDSGVWTQKLAYTNTGFLNDGGFSQVNTQLTTGSQSSINYLAPSFNQKLDFSYPITVNNTYGLYNGGSQVKIDAWLTRGLSWTDTGRPDISVFSLVAGPSSLNTAQDGTGHYSSVTNDTYSFGTTHQTFTETSYGTAYARQVSAVNGTVISDTQPLGQYSATPPTWFEIPSEVVLFGAPKGLIGRGPGNLNKET